MRKFVMMIGLLGSLSFTLMPSQVWAGEYLNQVKKQLLKMKVFAMNKGYYETHDDKFDKLKSGKTDSFSFRLKGGKHYLIASVCDNDCKDIDLTLYNEEGDKVKEDKKTDYYPFLLITPSYTAKYKLKVKMYECSSEPCLYGISILAK